jgi:hypothetical protein
MSRYVIYVCIIHAGTTCLSLSCLKPWIISIYIWVLYNLNYSQIVSAAGTHAEVPILYVSRTKPTSIYGISAFDCIPIITSMIETATLFYLIYWDFILRDTFAKWFLLTLFNFTFITEITSIYYLFNFELFAVIFPFFY